MNSFCSTAGMAMLDGHVFAIGGWDGSSRLDSVERYNPVLNTWEFIPPMKIALTSPAVVALRGLLFVTGRWGIHCGSILHGLVHGFEHHMFAV